MSTARTPREAWIEAGLAALAAGGPDSVRIEVLARTLKVTKGGFYGFFADRLDLLEQILATWERRSGAEVIERVDAEDGRSTLDRAVRAADLTFSAELLPVDLAIRDWARRDPAVAERLRRVDNLRLDLLRTSFRRDFPDPGELEARCLLAFSAAIAGDLIAADHPGQTRQEVLERATTLLFPRAADEPGTDPSDIQGRADVQAR